MDSQRAPDATRRIEIRGPLSRADAEMLQLELRRVARRHGIEVTAIRVERTEEC